MKFTQIGGKKMSDGMKSTQIGGKKMRAERENDGNDDGKE